MAEDHSMEAVRAYAAACRLPPHTGHQDRQRAWVVTCTRLALIVMRANAGEDSTEYFLWKMARRRAMMEIGVEDWGLDTARWM